MVVSEGAIIQRNIINVSRRYTKPAISTTTNSVQPLFKPHVRTGKL